MTARDQAIVDALLERMGGGTGAAWVESLKAGVNGHRRLRRTAEVHWFMEYQSFGEGGCYWPEMPESFEEFVEGARLHAWSVFYGECCEELGINTDAVEFEDHEVWLFVIDLEDWVLSPSDDAVYEARRRHGSVLERVFAALASPTPSPAMVEAMSKCLCRSNQWPYPGSLRFCHEPVFPEPEPPPVPYELRRGAHAAAPGAAPPKPKAPVLRDGAFLASVREAQSAARAGADRRLALWWLGQGGFLVHWAGRFLLLDPFLAHRDPRPCGAGDPTSVRLTGRVIAPERLDFIDLVVVGHHEEDHMEAETLRAVGRVSPGAILVCPESLVDLARERSRWPAGRIHGVDTRPGGGPGYPAMDRGGRSVLGFRFLPVLGEHRRGRDGLRHPPMGFLLERGGVAVYLGCHARPDGRAIEELKAWHVAMALLPINGRVRDDDPSGNFWGDEAARVAQDMGAQLVIPCHYDLFAHETVSPTEFVSACERMGQAFRLLGQGERLDLAIEP